MSDTYPIIFNESAILALLVCTSRFIADQIIPKQILADIADDFREKKKIFSSVWRRYPDVPADTSVLQILKIAYKYCMIGIGIYIIELKHMK